MAFAVICEDDQDAPITVGPVAAEDRALALKSQIEYELLEGPRDRTASLDGPGQAREAAHAGMTRPPAVRGNRGHDARWREGS